MSSYYDGGWAPYVTVAERRRKAVQEVEKLRRKGHPVEPVTIEGRKIATTFWGKAWCDNMESYRDFEYRLPRGRSYARNGAVVDLQIAPGKITALVSGSALYKVTINIDAAPKAKWMAICSECAGSIDSLVDLLQGKLSESVMQRLCRQDGGLFPNPSEIHFSCSCPDHASLCKHVAAVLYGGGARLDHKPELLFRLRSVNESELVSQIDTALPMTTETVSSSKMLQADDVSALFGLDMAEALTASPLTEKTQSTRSPRTASTPSNKRATAKTAKKQSNGSAKTGARDVPSTSASDRPRITKPRSVRTR